MNAVPKRERVHRMAFKHVAADENETPRDPWQGAASQDSG
jgi:hypothetical protein